MSDPQNQPFSGVQSRIIVIALPAAHQRLGWSLLYLLFFAGSGWLATRTTSLTCLRASLAEARCTLTETGPLGRSYVYEPGAIGAVEVEPRSRGKANSSPTFCVTLLDRRGSERDVGCYEKEVYASAERDRLRRYLATSTLLRYSLETSPSIVAYVLIVLGFAQFVVVLAIAFAHAGKIRVRVEASNELGVRWSLFGVPLGKTHAFPLDACADVRLELGPVHTWFYEHPERGARLRIALHGPKSVPVTPYLPQIAQLEQGVAEIRSALGIHPPGGAPGTPSAREPSTRHDQRAGGTAAQQHEFAKVRRKLEQVFHERRSLALLILGGLLVAVVGPLGVELWSERSDGVLELYAESRCVFEGATLLPGGNLRTSLKPGVHSVSVFNPDVPGGYEERSLEIVRGHTTVVHCRPTASAR